MSLNKLAKVIHQNAVDHGWWEKDMHFGSLIALMHSELSEALEEYRNGHAPNEIYYICNQNPAIKERCSFEEAEIESNCCPYAEISHGECEYRDRKPEGIPIELADCIIRILDYCGKEGIDIEEAIKKKHEYNKTRSY